MRERPDPCSPFLPKPDDPTLSVRSGTNQADPRTEISEDDTGDKAPKRIKPIKKVPKAEVRPGPELGEVGRACGSRQSPPSPSLPQPPASKTLKTRPKKKTSAGGDSA